MPSSSLLLFLPLCVTCYASQIAFDNVPRLGKVWEALGPFPMFAALSKLASAAHDSRRGTREWPLSPPTCQNLALDRDAFFQLNTSQHCSSLLAYGGDIGWTTFGADAKGQVTVSHPAIRWQDLRRSRGWSALQHQSLLRTSLDVPSDMDVFFDLTGAAEMWVEGAKNVLPGDLYQLGNGEQRIRLRRGRYRVAVRQVYDVRQHGDPTARSEIAPSSSFSLSIGFPDASPLRCMTTHMALPDILLGGRAASDLIGVWVQSQSNEAIEVIKATTDGQEQLSLLVGPTPLARWSRQRLAVRFESSRPPSRFDVHYRYKDSISMRVATCKLDFRQQDVPSTAFRFTYFASDDSVQWAMVNAPSTDCSEALPRPPVVVGLHGSGVSASDPLIIDAIPQQGDGAWIVMPQGRSLWAGFDWHGAALRDIFDALAALPALHRQLYGDDCVPDINRLVALGHSNGGQGAWYLASRYPDRVIAGAPAAAFSKINDYVHYDLEFSRIVDPALQGILMTGLTAFDNELHASNLHATAILAQHGSDDDNVPVEHSRRLVEVTNAWSEKPIARLIEWPKTNHWWPTVFRNEHIERFLRDCIAALSRPPSRLSGSFTLTTSLPDESGPLHGVRIAEVAVPGRLARIEVTFAGPSLLALSAANVHAVELDERYAGYEVNFGQETIRLASIRNKALILLPSGRPRVSTPDEAHEARRMGPLIQILDGRSPLLIVHPSTSAHQARAVRLATAIGMQGGPRTSVLDVNEAMRPESVPLLLRHGLIMLGDAYDNELLDASLAQIMMSVTFPARGVFAVRDRIFQRPGYGLIFALAHPLNTSLRALCIVGTDTVGLERALRLFPLRTGTPLPEWAVVSSKRTEGFVVGAGWWNRTWGWSEGMSYL